MYFLSLTQIRYVTVILKSDKHDYVWKTLTQTLLVPLYIYQMNHSYIWSWPRMWSHRTWSSWPRTVVSLSDVVLCWKTLRIGQTKKTFFSNYLLTWFLKKWGVYDRQKGDQSRENRVFIVQGCSESQARRIHSRGRTHLKSKIKISIASIII